MKNKYNYKIIDNIVNKIIQRMLNNSFNNKTQKNQNIKYIKFTYLGNNNHKIIKLFKKPLY